MRWRDLESKVVDRVPVGGNTQAKYLDAVAIVEPRIDSRLMSASAIINTDAVDYQDEVILAHGVEITGYRANPVVLWEHGLSGHNRPIGTSESPEGELMIDRSEYSIEATTYFSRVCPFAQQIFAMIEEGVVRATSIHVVPQMKSIRMATDGRKVTVTDASELVEYSWCSIGVNPEAVRKSFSEAWRQASALQADRADVVLSRGTLNGSVLLDPIRKSLQRLVPPAAVTSPGCDFSEKSGMTSQKKHLTMLEAKKIEKSQLKSMAESGEYDEESTDRMKSLYEEATGEVVEDEVIDESQPKADVEDDDDDSDDMPLGAKVLSESYAAMKAMVDYVTKALGPVENEVVKGGLQGEIENMTASLDAIAGMYSTAYPKLSALGDAVPAPEEVDAAEEQLKSLLSGKQNARFRFVGLAGCIDRIAADASIPEGQRKSLRSLGDRFGKLLTEAQSHQPALPSDVVPRSEHEALLAVVNRLSAAVDKYITPAS